MQNLNRDKESNVDNVNIFDRNNTKSHDQIKTTNNATPIIEQY